MDGFPSGIFGEFNVYVMEAFDWAKKSNQIKSSYFCSKLGRGRGGGVRGTST